MKANFLCGATFGRALFLALIFSTIPMSLDLSGRTAVAAVSAARAQTAEARTLKGFVHLANGKDIYVNYVRAEPGEPTAILLNGLTYRLGCWDAFASSFFRQLKKSGHSGIGLLRYDMEGQGETLLKVAPVTEVIPLLDQVEDLRELIAALGLTQGVDLVSLSYGGAVAIPFAALYPGLSRKVILMAPFVAPIASQEDWIQQQITQSRTMFPANPASDAELYNYFLRELVYGTYPLAEPIVLENPYKLEATYRLVEGVHTFQAKDYVDRLPAGKIHLMVARQDQYVPADMHEAFWQSVPLAARASRIFIEGSEHKIPEAVPGFSADWVIDIMTGNAEISAGRTFEGNPKSGTAESGATIIHVGE